MQNLRELSGKSQQKFEKKIANRQFLLGKYYETAKHHCKNRKQYTKYPKSKTARLLAKQIQLAKITKNLTARNQQSIEIQEKQIIRKQEDQRLTYQTYLPLNKFWNTYIIGLLKFQQTQQARELKFLRADFHGAKITVIDSRNKTCIGISGIVIKQTLRTFEVSVECNIGKKVVKIMKPICIFLFEVLDQFSFIVNGGSLVYRPSDRIKHKFKYKKAEDINFSFLQLLGELSQHQPEL